MSTALELAVSVLLAEIGLDDPGLVTVHVADPVRPMVVILGDRRAEPIEDAQ